MKAFVLNPPPPDTSQPKNNKVEAIGKFLMKLKKSSSYNIALLEELNKFNLKNFRDDLANAIGEAMTSKFDITLMIKVLASIWANYPDDEYRYSFFTALDKFLTDKKYICSN